MGIFKKKKKSQSATSDIELQNQTPIATSEEVFIKSNEELNKTDGVITIATIENEEVVPNNAMMPNQIDIEERRKKILQNRKEKIQKQTKRVRAKRQANTVTSLIVLAVIGLLGGFFYYIKNKETEKDFQLKVVNVELGETIPQNVSYYVKRNNIDEMEYSIDLSKVDSTKVGIYNYSVTHVGVTKESTIVVKDTISPEATTKDLVIQLGETFEPEDFVQSCSDLSNCNYEFENDLILDSNRQVGKYEVYIVITDDYNNLTRKKANLEVVEVLETLTCTSETDLTEDYNYYLYDILKITHADKKYLKHDYYKEFHFNNEDKYLNYKKQYGNNEKYIFNDENQLLTLIQDFKADHQKTLEDYKQQYEASGYTCTID